MKLAKKKVQATGDYSWALSYVDTLTLLLCFFIIFFSFNKKEEDPTMKVLKKLEKSFPGIPGGKQSSIEGSGKKARSMSPLGRAISSAYFGPEKVVDSSKTYQINLPSAKATVRKEPHQILIDFDTISFFDLGKTSPNVEGQKIIEDVMAMLRPYKDNLSITVQGHTDPTPVSQKRVKFSDNWELSVLRATSVLKAFIQNGYSPKHMHASGQAATEQIPSEDINQFQRKVTFVIRGVQDA